MGVVRRTKPSGEELILRRILVKAVTDTEVCTKLAAVIATRQFRPAELFGPAASWILGKCFVHLEKYGETPGLHIQDIFEKEFSGEEDSGESIRGVLLNLSSSTELQEGFLLDEAVDYINKAELRLMLDKSGQLLKAGHTNEASSILVAYAPPTLEAPKGFTAEQLMAMDLKEPVFIVPDLLPVGASLLVGPPKVGKSWMLLQLAVAVAKGRPFFERETEKSAVFYLALEDTEIRLRKRLVDVLVGNAPSNLHLHTSWPRVGAGGERELAKFLESHSDVKLVLIDTLEKIRPTRCARGNPYSEDYVAIGALKSVADRFGVAIVTAHHTRKAAAKDFLDRVSGTTGHTGSADTILVIQRDRSRIAAVLDVTGRDVQEGRLALEFKLGDGPWRWIADADELEEEEKITPERREILDLLKGTSEPMSPADIAKATGKPVNNIRQLLLALKKAGDIRMVAFGKYRNNDNDGNDSSKVISQEKVRKHLFRCRDEVEEE